MYIDRLGVQCVVVRHDMSRLYQGICGKFSLKYRGDQMSLGDPVGNVREREEEEKGSVVVAVDLHAAFQLYQGTAEKFS